MSLRIAVIGAGIAGVTSAYELSAEGHQVTVFERRGSVAAEGSFANAGLVVPGLVLAWTPPRAPRLSDGQALAWQWQRWRAGRNKNASPAHQNLLQLALHSSARLQQLRRNQRTRARAEVNSSGKGKVGNAHAALDDLEIAL